MPELLSSSYGASLFQKNFPKPLVCRICRHRAHESISGSPHDYQNPPLNGHAPSFIALLAIGDFILKVEWILENHLLEFVRTNAMSLEVGYVPSVPLEVRVGGHN
jgi:hypothetical protein